MGYFLQMYPFWIGCYPVAWVAPCCLRLRGDRQRSKGLFAHSSDLVTSVDGLFRCFPFFCWDKSEWYYVDTKKTLVKNSITFLLTFFFSKSSRKWRSRRRLVKMRLLRGTFFLKMDLCFLVEDEYWIHHFWQFESQQKPWIWSHLSGNFDAPKKW